MQYDVFIAHPSEHKDAARSIAAALRGRGLCPFVDEQLDPGADWMESLRRIQEGCRASVVLWTHDLVARPYLRDEVRTALERNARYGHLVFPVWVGPPGGRLPYGLDAFQASVDADRVVEEVCRQLGDPVHAREQEIARLEAVLDGLRGEGASTVEVAARLRALRRERRVEDVPTRLGTWEILEPIGKGGFATVYLARPIGGVRTRRVAIKVLHADRASHPDSVSRFCSGSVKMEELEHPGIVKVIQWATPEMKQEHSHVFFVMEHIDGEDLQRRVTGGLAVEAGIEAVLAVADALAHAHARGRVHRDVKPANILLGRDGRAKITDFDLVLAEESTHGTRTGAALGTMLYAAPEQLESAGTVDQRADVYGLGMVLAFVLAGGKVNAREAMFRRERFLAGLPCSEALREVVRRATEPEEDARTGDMRALAKEIRGVVGAVGEEPAGPSDAVDLRPEPVEPSAPQDAPALEAHLKPNLGFPQARGLRSLQHRLGSARRGQVAPEVPKGAVPVGGSASSAAFAPGQTVHEVGGLRFVYIPGGTFLMGRRAQPPAGSVEAAHNSGRETQRSVTLSPFAMAVTPVTQAQWRVFAAGLNADPSHFKGKPDSDERPVECVSWFDAVRWCNALSKKEGRTPVYEWDADKLREADGKTWEQWHDDEALRNRLADAVRQVPGDGYRLPTEAEWERACRAGTVTSFWSGETEADLARVGWYGNQGKAGGNSGNETHPVGQKPPNTWGLHDVHGNVWEWCGDWFANYDPQALLNPIGPSRGVGRVVRGGSYWFDPVWCRSAYRDWVGPVSRLGDLGFRVVLPLSPPPG